MAAKKIYEIEIQRNNISPKQFFSYCKAQMKKRTGVDLASWCESYEDWSGESGVPEYNCQSNHEDWDEPVKEICKTTAFDWQMFLGKCYNFILEFQFDTENKGYGYMYAVEFER